jgi:hypothetical protein
VKAKEGQMLNPMLGVGMDAGRPAFQLKSYAGVRGIEASADVFMNQHLSAQAYHGHHHGHHHHNHRRHDRHLHNQHSVRAFDDAAIEAAPEDDVPPPPRYYR